MLFSEIVDSELPKSWFFKFLKIRMKIIPIRKLSGAIMNYALMIVIMQLIDFDEEAQRIYFRRKVELEKKN